MKSGLLPTSALDTPVCNRSPEELVAVHVLCPQVWTIRAYIRSFTLTHQGSLSDWESGTPQAFCITKPTTRLLEEGGSE
jgi:hypothetical protein